jgi:hypothetical protein
MAHRSHQLQAPSLKANASIQKQPEQLATRPAVSDVVSLCRPMVARRGRALEPGPKVAML